ncbi:MAG: prepilin-type N-terminal cleavage/methylation domain-containing protein [Candidatus Paceibacterota bacterium]
MMFRHKNNRKMGGFTLIELLVVISIISLLSSIVITAVSKARTKARDSQRVQTARSLTTAIALYRANNNNAFPVPLNSVNGYMETYYPTSPLTDPTNAFAQAMSPYIKPVNDPIRNGNPYYFFVLQPNATWISSNSWSGLTASCSGHRLLVVHQMENPGSWQQDCPASSVQQIIIFLD